MSIPTVVTVVQQHRAALLAREQATMQAAAQRWLGVETALNAQVDALALELANTGTPTWGQLTRSRRYAALRQQINAELGKYADYMDDTITRGQRNMAVMALEHSARAIDAVATEAGIVAQFDRISVAAVEDMIGLAGDGTPLRAILDDAARGAGDALGQQLVNGIALGKNPIDVARAAMRLGLGQSFTRMQAISRTEMLRAYRTSTLESYRQSRIVTAYRRLSAHDRRTCLGCLFADGTVYALETDFEQHTNCRCTLLPVLANVPPIQYETGREWFAKQTADAQRDMMGPSRYSAWNAGKVSFDDMINRTFSDRWGGAITAKSVQGLGIPIVSAPRRPRITAAPSRAARSTTRPRGSVSLTPVSQEAPRLQQAWVHVSNTSGGIVLKEAVKSEFGITNRLVMNPRGHEIAASQIANAKPAVREMYNKTQAYFKERGITEVKLYRGVKSQTNVHGVIESWTTDPKTARKFNGHGVMEKNVPVEKILLAHDGPGWKNGRYGQQYEYVVMP